MVLLLQGLDMVDIRPRDLECRSGPSCARESSMSSTLVGISEARERIAAGQAIVVDCRFDLAAPDAGVEAWRVGHLPGARYAHLAHDLSGPPVTDKGRHPLPTAEQLCAVFSALGIDTGKFVIAYDAAGGGLAAARLWWLLRYMGHYQVAVLDGGWQAWCRHGEAVSTAMSDHPCAVFQGAPRADRRVLLETLAPSLQLLDARDPVRYRGESEPIDPRAGHIPGARNHFWQKNLTPNGLFQTVPALRQALVDSLGTLPDGETIHYCGSGVSACHNVLAQVHAGLPEPRGYCGSWSEWCLDPARPATLGNS